MTMRSSTRPLATFFPLAQRCAPSLAVAGPSRSHSSSSSPSASHAYALPPPPTHSRAAPPSPFAPPPPSPPPSPATSTSPPSPSPELASLLASIIRVDQAGELGANWIYRGQAFGSALRRDKATQADVEDMWESEKHHLNVMALLRAQHGVRPTLLYPLWQGMAFALGAGTAIMGREAAMACTEAVETVIGEHYDDQIKALEPFLKPENNPHPSLPLLKQVLEEFRDDELEHLDTAVEEGAQKAPGHSLLSAVIGMGCKAAIQVAKRI